MISVCLCDPHPIVEQGLRSILDPCQDIEFLNTTTNLGDARSEIERSSPTLVIVDRSFGMHNILEWIAEMRANFPETQVVVWAASISDVECFRALQVGARGIVRKTSDTQAILDCLRTAARKQMWTENLLLSKESPLAPPRTRPLTPREQQVAALVAKGMKNREIAETLKIATGTVKIHLMHIFEKTGIRDRFELALHGLRRACERAEEQDTPAEEAIPADFAPQLQESSVESE